MAKTSTTLAGAIGPSDWYVNLANKAALRPGDNIVIGTETMRALVVDPAGPAVVFRGARGTNGQSAAGGAVANYGPPTDWGVGIGVLNVTVADRARDAEAEEAAAKADPNPRGRRE